MKEFWNERYAKEEFIYGTEPNEFLKEELNRLRKGKIILPADGEGRNAVYAAKIGWQVSAFDYSESAKRKALQLAEQKKVLIDFDVADINNKVYDENSADVVALIYAHFPSDLRKVAHKKAVKWLKPGGVLILEAFNPRQLLQNSGGPKNIELLYTEETLRNDFEELNISVLESLEIKLAEGKFHEGKADVVRFIGVKE